MVYQSIVDHLPYSWNRNIGTPSGHLTLALPVDGCFLVSIAAVLLVIVAIGFTRWPTTQKHLLALRNVP
jgi:hypothetical protein